MAAIEKWSRSDSSCAQKPLPLPQSKTLRLGEGRINFETMQVSRMSIVIYLRPIEAVCTWVNGEGRPVRPDRGCASGMNDPHQVSLGWGLVIQRCSQDVAAFFFLGKTVTRI